MKIPLLLSYVNRNLLSETSDRLN